MDDFLEYEYENVKKLGIIGFIGNSKDLWYPAFFKFDHFFDTIARFILSFEKSYKKYYFYYIIIIFS